MLVSSTSARQRQQRPADTQQLAGRQPRSCRSPAGAAAAGAAAMAGPCRLSHSSDTQPGWGCHPCRYAAARVGVHAAAAGSGCLLQHGHLRHAASRVEQPRAAAAAVSGWDVAFGHRACLLGQHGQSEVAKPNGQLRGLWSLAKLPPGAQLPCGMPARLPARPPASLPACLPVCLRWCGRWLDSRGLGSLPLLPPASRGQPVCCSTSHLGLQFMSAPPPAMTAHACPCPPGLLAGCGRPWHEPGMDLLPQQLLVVAHRVPGPGGVGGPSTR